MAKCHLRIQFNRADRTYRPGEKIAGTVEVISAADWKCRKITLTPRWTTHGVGVADSAEAEGQVLPGAVWKNDERVSYPFEFSVPSQPLSYRGELFEVAWSLKAVADLPLAFDAVAEEKFALVHPDPKATPSSWSQQVAFNPFFVVGPQRRKVTHPGVYTALSLVPYLIGVPVLLAIGWYAFTRREQIVSGDWVGPVIAGLMILAGFKIILGGFHRSMLERRRAAENQLTTRSAQPGTDLPRPPGRYWQKAGWTDSPRGWAKVAVTLSLSGIGLFMLLASAMAVAARGVAALDLSQVVYLLVGTGLILATLRGVAASARLIKTRWKLGRVDVGFKPSEPRCGDDLHCSVEFRPPAATRLEQATARLEAIEAADYFTKKKHVTDARLIHQQEVTLARHRPLLAQESVFLSGTIPVPAEAPPTFLAADHKVLWFVIVHMQFAGGLRWFAETPVFVRS